MSASFVVVGEEGRIVKTISTVISSPEISLSSGERFSWRDTFFGNAPQLPAVVELSLGRAKAMMKRGSANHTPLYDVIVESTDVDDLFKLVSVCIKKFGGETIAIDPEPREYSFIKGVRDDFRRLCSYAKLLWEKLAKRIEIAMSK